MTEQEKLQETKRRLIDILSGAEMKMKPEERMKLFQLVVAGEQCVSWEEFKRKMHNRKWLARAIREKLIQKKSEVDFLEDILDNLKY
jgi:hypothetical protein